MVRVLTFRSMGCWTSLLLTHDTGTEKRDSLIRPESCPRLFAGKTLVGVCADQDVGAGPFWSPLSTLMEKSPEPGSSYRGPYPPTHLVLGRLLGLKLQKSRGKPV